MTTFDLRTLRLRSGDQARERVEIELEPLLLAGQSYEPRPNPAPAELTVTRASSGTVLELAFDVSLAGPCFRCLQDSELALELQLEAGAGNGRLGHDRDRAREFGHDGSPGSAATHP